MNQPAPNVTFIPSRPLLAAGKESFVDILVRIEAPPPVDVKNERRFLNFAIVLDRSGSMQGPKLRKAKEAVAFAIRNMYPEDIVSLTIYDGAVEALVSPATVKEVAPHLPSLLGRVHSGGSTALHDAWVRGGLLATERLDPKRLNRVLLISDGIANVGETRPDVIAAHARGLLDRGVSTSTVGVGEDFNEDLMIAVAKAGGGVGWFVETPDDFRRIFEAELSGLVATYGEKGALRIEPRRRGVEVTDLLNDFPKTDTDYEIGSLLYGQSLEIVLRLKVHGGEVGQPLDLFDLRLSWEIPGEGRVELQQLFRISCGDPLAVEVLPLDPSVDRAVSLLMAARARQEAIRHLDHGNVDAALGVVMAQETRFATRFADGLDPEDRLESDELFALARLMQDKADPKRTSAMARKLASYQLYLRSSRSRRRP